MIEALKQALDALEYIDNNYMSLPKVGNEAITSLRQAIKELESQEPDKYEMDIECTKCGAKQSGVLTVNTHPTQRTWVGLTGEMLLKAAQSSLAPEQYDHFEAMSKHQPDIYDRLAYAIRVQDE